MFLGRFGVVDFGVFWGGFGDFGVFWVYKLRYWVFSGFGFGLLIGVVARGFRLCGSWVSVFCFG